MAMNLVSLRADQKENNRKSLFPAIGFTVQLKRLQKLEALCNEPGKKQIDSARNYSDEVLEWRKRQTEEEKKLQQAQKKRSKPDPPRYV